MPIRALWLSMLALATACGGKGGDVCDAYPGVGCIALLVDAPVGIPLTVDQIGLSGDIGFALDDTRNPMPARDTGVSLPVTMALLPGGTFAGNFSIGVVGWLQQTNIGSAIAVGNFTTGQHLRVEVTLAPFGLDGGVPDNGVLADMTLPPDFAHPPTDFSGVDLSGVDFAIANPGPTNDVAEDVVNTWLVGESLTDTLQACNPVTHGTVSLAAETSMVKVGTQAVRIDYGPNTHYYFDAVYPKSRDAGWNLSGRTGLQMWLTAQLPVSYIAWQPVAPELVLCSRAGGYRRMAPTTNHTNRNAEPYVQLQIPLLAGTGWNQTDVGNFDITNVDSIEIHLDPQAAANGMGDIHVWIDGVGFY